MNKIARTFLDSLTAQLKNSASLSAFIESDTWLNGKPFSFKGHEYQEYLCNLLETRPGHILNVLKPSQIGLSEIANRVVLALMALFPGIGALISFPSKLFAQEVLKTRFASIISESPKLSGMLNRDIDSASAKAFHNGSIMYALGGSKNSSGSLLNRPIAVCLIDELDRQDPDIVTGYRSRMTHTPAEKRVIIRISTPTVQGIGIDAEFNESREQHVALTKCEHCGHEFEPDYYAHVKIPEYNESLLILTKSKAALLPIEDAFLECPECLKAIVKPKLVWRIDYNPLGMKNTIGVKLSPFCAPEFISMPDLVESSLSYTSHVEFLNQGLGRVADLKDSSIQREHIHFEHKPMVPAQQIFGLDLGKLCHFVKGRLNNDTTLHVDEMHIVKLSELEDFLQEQFQKTVFSAAVLDSQPYSDLVYRLVKKYPRLYSAIYVSPTTPIPELFKLKIDDKYDEMVRQVSINKSPMMDLLSNSLNNFVTFEPSPMEGLMVKHLLDMRRVRDYRFEEMIYMWIKSKIGEDHFFHAMTYFFTAGKLAMAGLDDSFAIPTLLMKFKHRQ